MKSLFKTFLLIICIVPSFWGCKKENGPEPGDPAMALVANFLTANAGDEITFDITNPASGFTGARWDFGDGSTPQNTTVISNRHTYNNGGTYTVKVDVYINGTTTTLTTSVTIEGQVVKNARLTYARIINYNQNTSLWDNAHYGNTSVNRYPDMYLRVRVKKGANYEVLLNKSAVVTNYISSGEGLSFDHIPMVIDEIEELELTLMNDNTNEFSADNQVAKFTKSKAQLLDMYNQGTFSDFEWISTDSYSRINVVLVWPA